MKASDCSFETMCALAPQIPDLPLLLSFVQVEEGLSELRGHWDGFVDVSDDYGLVFSSRKQICNDFASVLSEFVELSEVATF